MTTLVCEGCHTEIKVRPGGIIVKSRGQKCPNCGEMELSEYASEMYDVFDFAPDFKAIHRSSMVVPIVKAAADGLDNPLD